MQNTTNFNLNKPEGTDIYNIQNENDNMDIIDAALAKAHSTDDSASTDIADGDYLPFYDTSATEKKKMLLSTARKDVRARIAEAVSNDVIETIGAKALNSYSVGQYFLGNDGYYYAATAAITANTTTLNSGVSGNCSKTSIAAGMNSLSSQISNLESNIDETYQFLGLKTLELVTANGSKTVSTLLTEAINAIRTININEEWPGATRVRFRSLSFAYGNGTSSTVTLYNVNYMSLQSQTSLPNVLAIEFSRLTSNSGNAAVYIANLNTNSSSNIAIYQLFSTGTATNLLTNKPSSGTKITLGLDFYKEV